MGKLYDLREVGIVHFLKYFVQPVRKLINALLINDFFLLFIQY